MCLTKIDRVVTSAGGKLVSTERVNVFQSLDPSIIKSINVHEGDEVQAGQGSGDARPDIRCGGRQAAQAAGRRFASANSARRSAAQQPSFALPQETDPDALKSAAVQKEFYNQQVAQYKAQLSSFDAKISQTQATIQKYQADASRYQQREQIAKQIEDMRATLAEHGTGSQLNLLTSQDQRLEMLRTLE